MKFINLKSTLYLVMAMATATSSVGLFKSFNMDSAPIVPTPSLSPTTIVTPTVTVTKKIPATPTPTKAVSSTQPTSTPTPGTQNGTGGSNTSQPTPTVAAPTATPQPTTPTATPTVAPTQTPTPTQAPANPGFTVSPSALNMTIGSRSRIENAFTVSYAGADSFELSVSLWYGGFVFSPSISALTPGQTVNISLQTYGAPTGITNGTATFKNPVNGATIAIPIHLTVN